ncbi:MAG TPA: transcription antitermination factor NusB [Rhizomicrobium sp.]
MSDAGIPARAAALSILGEVLRRRRPLDAALDDVLPSANLSQRDAGFARAIVSETLRRFGVLDALIKSYVPKPPPPHKSGPTVEILLAGACELLFLDVSDHAAVDAANRLAARDKKAVHFKPLINATLRRVAREGRQTLAALDGERLCVPDWLWPRWLESFGEDAARAIARAHLAEPPLDIVLKNEATLPDGEPLFGAVVRFKARPRVDELPGFASGDFWVQDFAATLPARLLGDVKGQTVIDLCAAPGGKTAQLATLGANVIAVEREPARMARLKENLARLKLDATLIESDMRDYVPDAPVPFVLLDAPCSATGTIRRHPELPWIKSAADVNVCVQAARELLDYAANMVAPDGLLVFAVCSLEPEEGAQQIDDFLAHRDDFLRAPIAPDEVFGLHELISGDGDLRTLPCHLAAHGGMDGFYAARLKRSA